jgi:uncharacterized protein (TIGR00369 family)
MAMNVNDEGSRRKRQEELIRFFDKAPIKRTFGMEFHYDDEGSAVFDLPYNSGLDHALGGIHGGVMATLLDNAGWFTAAALFDTWIATSDLSVKLLVPVERKALRSRGRVLRAGSRLAVCEMEVRTEDGVLAAVGQGSFIVTSVSTMADK